MKKNPIYLSILFIAVSLFILFLVLYWKECIYNTEIKFINIFLNIMITIGIALFTMGIFSIIIQTKDWKIYFEKGLANVVLKQDFLNSLNNEQLVNIQTNTLKAYFNNKDIDREGSFLKYFHERVHKYISLPYREDVNGELIISKNDSNSYKVFDRVSYVCRKVGNSIVEDVKFLPDKDEFLEVKYCKMELKYPYNHEKAGQSEKKEKNKWNRIEKGFILSLEEYKDIDGLIIEITSEYLIDNRKFQYWEMSHPTKNFNFTIKYPNDLHLEIKPFVSHPKECRQTNEIGYCSIKYNSWLLPNTGIAYRLFPERD